MTYPTVHVGADLQFGGDILPASTRTRSIGSPERRWKSIYVDEAHLSVNTLYLGDTPVLGTSQDVVQIRADPNQGISVSTTGTGQTVLTSQAATLISTNGTNADVLVQASGQGSTVRLTAPVEVRLTAPVVAAYGNLTVGGTTSLSGSLTVIGNLNVQGTTVTLDTTNVAIDDNVVMLNRGETGAGVSLRFSGFQVDRGELTDARIVWDESAGRFVAGLVGAEVGLASVGELAAKANVADVYTRAETAAGIDVAVAAATADFLRASDNELPVAGGSVAGASLAASATTPQVVDSFPTSVYRSAEFLIQATSGAAHHVTKVLVVHDGTTAQMVEYGEVRTGASLVTLDVSVSGGIMRLLATPASAATTVRSIRTAVCV